MDSSLGVPFQKYNSQGPLKELSVNARRVACGSRPKHRSGSTQYPDRMVRPIQSEQDKSLARAVLERESPIVNTFYTDSLARQLFGEGVSELSKRRVINDRAASSDLSGIAERVLPIHRRSHDSSCIVRKLRCTYESNFGEVEDDYYSHPLLCMGKGCAAVAVGNKIVSQGFAGEKPRVVLEVPDDGNDTFWSEGDRVTAMAFMSGGRVVYGTTTGCVRLRDDLNNVDKIWYDESAEGPIEISAVEVFNDDLVAVGDKCGNFWILDTTSSDLVLDCKGAGYTREGACCAVKLQPSSHIKNGGGLVAFGTGEPSVSIMQKDSGSSLTELLVYSEHKAGGVKALDWHPTIPNLIASGGGTEDRSLRIWKFDSESGRYETLVALELDSQITDLAWSNDGSRLVVTLGYPNSRVELYKYDAPSTRITLEGRSENFSMKRVLAVSIAPDDGRAVTVGADSKLRIWDIPKQKQPALPSSRFSTMKFPNHIR